MTTSITFETAALADSIKKAAAIAPTKGAAFDKVAGLVFDLWPGDPLQVRDGICTIRSCNMDTYYTEWLSFKDSSGEPVTWRLPSALLDGIVGGLPIGSNKQVKLTQDGNTVILQSGRTKAKLRLLETKYYPNWGQFDSSLTRAVPGLGGRLKQVQWAAARGADIPLTGLHMDGERIIATDRYSLVTVPCAAESIYKPITVPAGIVAPLLKDESDTFIGINDDMLLMMPDESTQIKCVIYAADFPNVEKAMRRDHSRQVMFYKNQFNDMIQRMLNLVKSDRAPLLIMEIGNEELVVRTADPEMGAMEDAIEVPGQCIHDLHKVFVAPDRINKAIISSPNEQVTLHYEPSDAKAFLRIDGGSGYEAWVATRTGAKS